MNAVSLAAHPQNSEQKSGAASGWLALLMTLGVFVAAVYLIAVGCRGQDVIVAPVLAGVAALLTAIGMCCGFFTLQPNEAAVLILFGAYKGTVRDSGFFFTNPFNKKLKISLRARNLNGEKLKVNDKRGNPVEIAAVVVWRVQDTAQAVFDVDSYENYVKIQSESAVRHVASRYAYETAAPFGNV